MGVFQRVSDILKANINRMLDKAEDPELVLDQLIQEMQESYRRSKIEVAKALADEKSLKHKLQTNQDMAQKWGRKAVLAVERNDDDLAREALKRKRSYEDISHEFQSQWTEQKKVTDVLRENLFGLESKIDEARRKKSLLVARQKRVLAQKKLQDTLDQATSEQAYWTVGRFEEKITEIEARAEAEIDLLDGEFDGRFRELEGRSGENVEDELAALKTQVGGRRAGEGPKLLEPETEVDEDLLTDELMAQPPASSTTARSDASAPASEAAEASTVEESDELISPPLASEQGLQQGAADLTSGPAAVQNAGASGVEEHEPSPTTTAASSDQPDLALRSPGAPGIEEPASVPASEQTMPGAFQGISPQNEPDNALDEPDNASMPRQPEAAPKLSAASGQEASGPAGTDESASALPPEEPRPMPEPAVASVPQAPPSPAAVPAAAESRNESGSRSPAEERERRRREWSEGGI